ncbi:hypothetical protein BKA70DRAFT_1253799 [Coprinopsis sp. MPI-PUGE-AT-0042]|nr:hypothetical protein BKA70DRAFT_1253799 [Coprinopsis sp. MPI-PUGE-AT-0042]
MQHLAGHESHHRRALEKRQIRKVVTTVVTEAETTFTSVFTTRTPLIPLPTAIFGDDEDEEETTTSRRRSSTSSTPRATSSAATARPTSSSSSVLSSVIPSSSSSSAVTSRPVASIEVDTVTPLVTSVVNQTRAPASSASASDLPSTEAVGGAKSTGQIVGIVVGVVAGVIGVAIFAAFIVRHMRKRANDKEAWSASKFRQSALLLNDNNNGGNGGSGPPAKRGPRPPSMIERREAANTGSIIGGPPASISRAYPYTDGPAGFNPQEQLGYNRVGTPHQPQQYGAPNPYGAAPIPYSGQNMYGQGADRGYGAGMSPGYGGAAAGVGYGHQQGMDMHHPGFPARGQNGHNSLPPFASYAPRHEMDGHAFGPSGAIAGGMMQRNNTTASNLPNPFAERAPPTQSPPSPRDSGSSESGPVPPNKPRYMTRNGDEDVQDSRDAPPAYIDDGTYAKMQRDVKTPVVMSVEGTKTPSAPAPTSTPAPATATMGNNKARPMSSHTVYDPTDAYGGM